MKEDTPLYPFFDGTDHEYMATVWKNIHYTELRDSIVFDSLPDTLWVGNDREHLSRVRVYANAVGAHNSVMLDGLGSHSPVYSYGEYGCAQSIKLQARIDNSRQLPQIIEMADMLDDTSMMTVYVTRVGIEPVLALETSTDALETALLPNLQEIRVPYPKAFEEPSVFRAALVYPN